MRIAWSEQLGCMILDGVPLGMPEQPRGEVNPRSGLKSSSRNAEEIPGSFSDSDGRAAAPLD
jgi:hypothetical protein